MGLKLPPGLFRNAVEPVYTESRKCSLKQHEGPEVSTESHPAARQTAFKTCHLISSQLWQWRCQPAALWSFSLLCPWCTLHIELATTIASTRDMNGGTARPQHARDWWERSWGRAPLAPRCKAVVLRGQSGGRDLLQLCWPGRNELGWKDEWNGSAVELLKILHQALFTLQPRGQEYVPSSECSNMKDLQAGASPHHFPLTQKA